MKFVELCKMTQKELKNYLTKYLESKYNNVTAMDGFVYAEGNFPVLLVAHMDTVHKEPVKQIVYTDKCNIISSPQGIGGDDRCGCYMVSKIIETFNCSVLFTEDEEIGCIGANKFVQALADGQVKAPNVNYIIELDRQGKNDAVFYQCANQEFEDFILEDNDWSFAYGSYTDIVEIAPILGVAAVNFSCGYYNAHTLTEYVNVNEMEANIAKVNNLLARTTNEDRFEYIEEVRSYYRENNWWTKYESDYRDDKAYYISAHNKGKLIEDEIYAANEYEAIGMFLMDHTDICFDDILDFICEEDMY